VLFSHLTPGDDERLVVLDLTTGEQKMLVEGRVQNPFYSDTGHIVYARGTTLMAVPFDPDELAVTGPPVTLLEGVRQQGEFAAADYGLSRTSTLAYVPEAGEPLTDEVVWQIRPHGPRAVNSYFGLGLWVLVIRMKTFGRCPSIPTMSHTPCSPQWTMSSTPRCLPTAPGLPTYPIERARMRSGSCRIPTVFLHAFLRIVESSLAGRTTGRNSSIVEGAR
jgi:hypothetical protein